MTGQSYEECVRADAAEKLANRKDDDLDFMMKLIHDPVPRLRTEAVLYFKRHHELDVGINRELMRLTDEEAHPSVRSFYYYVLQQRVGYVELENRDEVAAYLLDRLRLEPEPTQVVGLIEGFFMLPLPGGLNFDPLPVLQGLAVDEKADPRVRAAAQKASDRAGEARK